MSEAKQTKRALIFDIDGLILDTETAEVEIWHDLYARAGVSFDMDAYKELVGSSGHGDYDPAQALVDREGETRSFQEVREDFRQIAYRYAEDQEPMEGVVDLISSAKAKNYLLAVGSSASYRWVGTHLSRLGLLEEFDVIVTSDDVESAKPSPDIFLKVIEKLGISADQALVLEDSLNGVLAANRAGIRVIAVPNPITIDQDFSLATAVVPSLAVLDPDKFF